MSHLLRRITQSLVVSIMFLSGHVAHAADLTVTTNTTLSTGSYTYDDVTVSNNANLTLEGTVHIIADNITVSSGSRITADKKGYVANSGPGAGAYVASGGSGAGHGGDGGRSIALPVAGKYYGSATHPVTMGSGGGGTGCTINSVAVNSGGKGGGGIWFEVENTLTVSGTISANGGDGSEFLCDAQSGGGAGGSIYIVTDTFAGAGDIVANGGKGGQTLLRGGGGGGGRIAIYYETSTFSGDVLATAGFGKTESGESGSGHDGTVGFFDTDGNDFSAGHIWRFQFDDQPFAFDMITIGDGSQTTTEGTITLTGTQLIVDGDSTLTLGADNSLVFKDVSVTGSSAIDGNLLLQANNLTIASGADVSANGLGFTGERGVGAGLPGIGQGGGGGGYGGEGGTNVGGIEYGSPTAPVDFGSGGAGPGFTSGGVAFASSGGYGGGKIQLNISGTLTVNGDLTANGNNAFAQGSQAGGGSGGSIYVITEKFTGSGTITANGGNSGPTGGSGAGGGGAGGRIAIFHRQSETFSGTPVATGGDGVGEDGENGTAILVSDVLAVYPTILGNTGQCTLILSGTVFGKDDVVKLVKSNEDDIIGDSITLNDTSTWMNVAFDLTEKPLGSWDLVLVKNGSTVTLTDAITIEQGKKSDVNIEFVGLKEMRPNRAQRYHVVYQNRGNTDAAGGLLLLSGIPSGATVTPDFKSSFMSIRDVSVNFPVKIVETEDEQVIPLAMDSLPVGQVEVFSFVIETPLETQIELKSIYVQGGLVSSLTFGKVDKVYLPSINPTDVPALEEAIDIAKAEVAVTGLFAYNFTVFQFNGLCVGQNFRLQAKLLDEPCQAQSTNLEDWRVRAIELFDKHNATLLTSPDGDRHYLIDTYANPGTSSLADLVEMEEVEADQLWIPMEDKGDNFNTLVYKTFYPHLPKEFRPFEPTITDMWSGVDQSVSCSPPGTVPEPNEGGGFSATVCFRPQETDFFTITIVISLDPNEKVGVEGVEEEGYITSKFFLNYSILFENLDTATAPAQEVLITDQLDAYVDLNTFSLGPITLGDKVITPPDGLQEYITEVDLRPDNDIIVRIEASLNTSTGLVTWKFVSLDPETHMLTSDPTAGFLPPNDDAPEGDGSVSFTVLPKDDLVTGDEIENSASIVFDTNSPITTSTWLNTIDDTKPSSSMNSMASTGTLTSFDIFWSGTDAHSGIKEYTIYVSENSGPFVETLTTSGTFTSFEGVNGSTYSFYTRATDNVGNFEDAPETPDETITIEDPMQEPCTINTDYIVGVTCFGTTTVANNSQLEDYLADYDYNGSNYKNLYINYSPTMEDLDVHSPCEITIAANKTLTGERICIDGRKGIDTATGLTVNGTLVSFISELEDSSIGGASTITANSLLIQAYKSAEIHSSAVINVDGPILIKSIGNTSTSWAKMGQSSTITAESVRLEAVREASTGTGMQLTVEAELEIISTGTESSSKVLTGISSDIDAGSLEMSADKSVEIGNTSTLDIDEDASLTSTGSSSTSDVTIKLESVITADSLDVTAGDDAVMQTDSEVHITNNFHMQAATTNDCTISSSAVIDAGSESGNCLP